MAPNVALVLAASLAAAASLLDGPALAADMPSLFPQSEDNETLPPQRYTFGSGWYLRGDLTTTDDVKPAFFGTLASNGSEKRDWGYGVGGGVGYKINEYFRTDLTGDYLNTQKTVANYFNDTLELKSNLRRYDGLLNVYLDLGNWSGITPYIGAGVGFGGVRLDGSYVYNNPATGQSLHYKYPGDTRYDLAWAAMAGVSYTVSQNLLLDIGYRYLDLGTYKTPNNPNAPFASVKTDLTSHQVRAGLRYMLY